MPPSPPRCRQTSFSSEFAFNHFPKSRNTETGKFGDDECIDKSQPWSQRSARRTFLLRDDRESERQTHNVAGGRKTFVPPLALWHRGIIVYLWLVRPKRPVSSVTQIFPVKRIR